MSRSRSSDVFFSWLFDMKKYMLDIHLYPSVAYSYANSVAPTPLPCLICPAKPYIIFDRVLWWLRFSLFLCGILCMVC